MVTKFFTRFDSEPAKARVSTTFFCSLRDRLRLHSIFCSLHLYVIDYINTMD
jgi:hypothetical protein